MSVEVILSLRPSLNAYEVTHCASHQVSRFEVNTAVAPGNPGFIGCITEGAPLQRHGIVWSQSRLNRRAARSEGHRVAEVVTACPKRQYGCAGCAKRTVAGDVLGKRWRGESRWLIGYPLRTIHRNRALVWAAPRLNLLALELVRDGGYRPHRVKHSLGVPGCDAGVEYRIGHGKEHLHVVIQRVTVTRRNILSEQTPVSRRSFGVRAVGPVFRDHLLLIGQISAESDQLLGLLLIRRRAVGRRPKQGDQA